MGNIYNASVAVPSKESDSRPGAFQAALNQVLIRVSGDERMILSDDTQVAFKPAESFVLAYSYKENPEYATYREALAAKNSAVVSAGDEPVVDELESAPGPSNGSELSAGTDHELLAPEPFILDVSFAEYTVNSRLGAYSSINSLVVSA